MLLKDVDDRKALYESITTNNATFGVAVIFILHIRPKNAAMSTSTLTTAHTNGTFSTATSKHCDPVEELQIIQEGRQAIEDIGLFDEEFRLVKYDDKRVFAMATEPIVAMKKMIQAKKVIRNTFQASPTATVNISGGCELGSLFELTSDYFGDPVNVASKLGEDTAGPGELLVSFGGREVEFITKLQSRATFELGTVEVSGVKIEYYLMEENDEVGISRTTSFTQRLLCCLGSKKQGLQGGAGAGATTGAGAGQARSIKPPVADSVNVPRSSMLDKQVSMLGENHGKMQDHEKLVAPEGVEWEELVMLQSDLSGFTRLTKKYGILHFMTLILNCRKIFQRHLLESDGEILKYDGDNNICKFKTTKSAIEFVHNVTEDLDKYNEGKEKDFQIRAKIGMAKGLVLVSDDGDIVGDGWEECCALSEGLAEVGEVLISEDIKVDLDGLDVKCEFEQRPPSEDPEMGTHYNLTLHR